MARKVKTAPATDELFADFTESEVIPDGKPLENSAAQPATQPSDISEARKRGRPRKDSPAPPVESIICGQDEANALLDLLQPITAWAAQRIYHVSPQVASRAFVFVPSHREKINPPLIRVMNKWLPSMVRKWQDEIGLGIVLGSVVNAQVTMMKLYDAAEKQAAASKVTPISQPEKEAPAPAPAPAAPAAD